MINDSGGMADLTKHSSINGAGKNVILVGKMKLNHWLTVYTKINSRYKDLMIKGKTWKILGENIRKFLSDLVWVIKNLKQHTKRLVVKENINK